MAHHLSAKKRIRQNAVRRLRNRFQLSTTRTLIKKLENMSKKDEAAALLQTVESRIDKCVKTSIYHRNKAGRLKSRLSRKVNSLA